MNTLMSNTIRLTLLFCVLSAGLPAAHAATFATPVATSFSKAVSISAQTVIQLQGSDADGTPLTFATTSSPSHGALSNLNAATGAVVYTPTAGYTGTDSFTFTVTSGGDTSTAATVSITVTAAKTRIVDTLTNLDGSPRSGRVSFFLSQVASSPSGLIPAKASVTAQLNSSGQFDVSLYPSQSVSPVQFYQLWFDDSATGNSQLLGVYDIPASTTTISLSGRRVTNANLGAQYAFASKAEVDALTAAVAAATTAQLYPSLTSGKHVLWNGSTFANSLISESGGVVTIGGDTTVSGGVTASGYTGITAANVPSLDAAKITTGRFPDARIASAAAWNAKQAALGYTPLNPANNLSDVSSATAARSSLGLGTMATQSSSSVAITGGSLTNVTCVACVGGVSGSGGVDNPDSTVIGAANESTGDAGGFITFRTRQADRLKVNNDGSLWAALRLGIGTNSASPTAPLDIDWAGNGNIIKFRTSESASGVGAPFAFNLFENTNPAGTRKNQTLSWGYNPSQQIAGEAAAFYSLESYYNLGANQYFEPHLVFIQDDGTLRRPFTWMLNRTTGYVQYLSRADEVTFQNGLGNATYASLTPTQLGLEGNLSINHYANNVVLMTQKNAAGTGQLNLFHVDADDTLQIFPGSGKKVHVRRPARFDNNAFTGVQAPQVEMVGPNGTDPVLLLRRYNDAATGDLLTARDQSDTHLMGIRTTGAVWAPTYCFDEAQTVCASKGNGSPEGVVPLNVGSTYSRQDGGAGTAFYVKESGNGTPNGWVAK